MDEPKSLSKIIRLCQIVVLHKFAVNPARVVYYRVQAHGIELRYDSRIFSMFYIEKSSRKHVPLKQIAQEYPKYYTNPHI